MYAQLLAKYTVMVSKQHCGQTFSIYLGRWEGRSPIKRGSRAQPANFFCDDFLWFFGTVVSVLQDRIRGKKEFQKTGSSRDWETRLFGAREVKMDAWKYFQTIVMGLYAVCEQKLEHPDCVLSLLL